MIPSIIILTILIIIVLLQLYTIHKCTKFLNKPCSCNIKPLNTEIAEDKKPVIIPTRVSRVTHLTDSYQEALRKRMQE